MTDFDPVKNFAISTVSGAPTPDPLASLNIEIDDPSALPDPDEDGNFNGIVWPAVGQPTHDNAEILRFTHLSGSTYTIVRAQEGSSARTIVVGDRVSAVITGKTITDIQNAINAIQSTIDTDESANADVVHRVVQNEDTTWPDRPSVTFVEWVGPGSPAPPSDDDNDTWVVSS